VRNTHPIAVALAGRGLRHDAFARRLGLSPWMLSHYLSGRRKPPDRFYRDAALVLDVPEASLRPRDEAAA
jgi:predicted transcriptional regulator